MSQLLDHDLLVRLGAIPVEARLPMLGNVAGKHRSPHRGSSVEFAEYRKYVPGDDTRRLDWKAYARSDRYYIKEFEADTNLRVYFVVDNSGSMSFADKGMAKIDYARRIVANLAYLFVNQGDAAGLSVCRDTLHIEIPPRRRLPQRRSQAHFRRQRRQRRAVRTARGQPMVAGRRRLRAAGWQSLRRKARRRSGEW